MPRFSYQAKQGPTEVIEGTIEAASQDEAVSRLMWQGLVPVLVAAMVISPDELAPPARTGARLSAKERRLFLRQLASLTRAKVELVPAIAMLRRQGASRALQALLEDIEHQLREGHRFSEALARHSAAFSPFVITAIRAGEAAGTLDGVLARLVEFGDQQEALESRFRSALAYPALLGILGIVSLIFFITFVVPRMSTLFVHLGGQLPWPTRVLVALGAWMSRWWLAGVAGLLLAALGMRLMWRVPALRRLLQATAERLPLLGPALEDRRIARFTRTMQLLLTNGLPVFQAMEVARPMLESADIESRMRQAQERVREGAAVAESLQAAGCFPPFVIHLMAVGEQGGVLADTLNELAAHYERSLDERLKVSSSLLEPLMIVIVGLAVGFCVLAMILPIFQLNQLIR